MSYTVAIREERTYVVNTSASDPSEAIARAYAIIRDANREGTIHALSPTVTSRATVLCSDIGDTDGDQYIDKHHQLSFDDMSMNYMEENKYDKAG